MNSSNVPADVLVIFGITGDLARKMTFRSLYRLERRKLLTCPIVGVARDGWSDDALRDHARAAIKAAGEPLDDSVFARFAARLSYVQGDYADEETFHRLAREVDGRRHPVFYLEIPPSLFARVVGGLAGIRLTKGAGLSWRNRSGTTSRRRAPSTPSCVSSSRIAAEDRPLPRQRAGDGHPVPAVRQLRVRAGVEPRPASPACRSPWPRTSGSRTAGTTTRSARSATSCRTICCSCSPWWRPSRRQPPTRTRSETAGLMCSGRSPTPTRPTTVRGQYEGYVQVPGVQPRSRTETFVALRLEVENWRWSGVPFFIRAGKSLPERVTEIRIMFKRPPRLAFAERFAPEPDGPVLRIDPSPGMNFCIQAKQPGKQATQLVDLDLLFAAELGEAPEPYERLLRDAMQGNASLFTREDSVEETWRIVQPLLEAPGDPSATGREPGDRRPRTSSSPDIRDGTNHGCRRALPTDTAAPGPGARRV